MTCRLFVDEVGNGDLNGAVADPNIRYLSLTGIITKLRAHSKFIQPGIDAFKGSFFDRTVILHRREIVRREGPFAILRDRDIALAFDAGLLELIAKMPYIAITVTIDKREHLERYLAWRFDPYHYCLRCLIERYVAWLDRQDLQGDVAVEPRYKLADKKLKSSFQRIYDDGTPHVPARIVQRRLLSRDIKFEPKSSNCAGIQLCDLIAHPSYRSMKFERDGQPERLDFGTRVVGVLRASRYARNPRTGEIAGWGRKWLP
jgi:hypothetical protein